MTAMTAKDVCAALVKRWPDDRYLHVYEAPLDQGRQGRKIDVLVLSLWASDGLAMDAVEVKVSYSDWCREWRQVRWFLTDHLGVEHRFYMKPTEFEIKRYTDPDRWTRETLIARGQADKIPPEGFTPTIERREEVDTSKSVDWRLRAHRFWVAAPAKLAAKIAADVERIPEMSGWGVISVGETNQTLVKPTVNRDRKPLTHAHYVGLMRAAADSGFQALIRAESRGREQGYREGKRDAIAAETRRREAQWNQVLACTS